jgi:hypothetical protein
VLTGAPPSPETPTSDEPPTPQPGSRPVAVGLALVVGALVLVPLLVALVTVAGRSWSPAGDWAMLELRTRDVGTGGTPLLGPYSRYAWNHPGPLLFWLLAVPYRLAGAAPWSLLAAAVALNVAAVAGVLVLAWRRGRLALVALVGVGLAVLLAHLGVAQLWDPWNPWVTVLPFALLVVACWAATCGDRLALPVAVLVGSFLVQAHVGFALLAVALLAWACVGALRSGAGRRTWAVAVAVGVACWLPVLVDQLFGQGNLLAILSHFSGDDDATGLGSSLELAARQLAWDGPWTGGEEPIEAVGGGVRGAGLGTLVVPLAAFGVAAAAAWAARARDALRLQGTVAIAAVVGVVSVARISGEAYDYLVRWWWVVAVLWWVSVGWSLWSAALATVGRPRWLEPAVGVAAAVVVVWASWGVVDEADRAVLPVEDLAPTLASLGPTVAEAAQGRGPVDVGGAGPRVGWLIDALGLELDRAGVAVLGPSDQVHKLGPHRDRAATDPAATVLVATGGEIDRVDRGRFDEVARWDPRSPESSARLVAAEAELRAALVAAGRDDLVGALDDGGGLWEARAIDEDLVDEIDELRADGYPVAVFLGPPDGLGWAPG